MNRTPLFNLTILLILYAFVTLGLNFSMENVYHLLEVSFLMVGGWALLTFVLKKPLDWKNTAISAIILFLVLNAPFDLKEYGFAALVVLLFFLGKLIRFRNLPVVNPIVFGLLAAHFVLMIFGEALFLTWWGTGYMGSWSLLFLAPVVAYAVYRFRKWWLVLAYLLSYIGITAVFDMPSVVYLITTSTLYFAAGIMLLEPKTSPVQRNDQLLFGVIAGLATFGFAQLHSTPPLLMGILTMNVAWWAKKRFIA